VDRPPEDADYPIALPPEHEAAVWANRFDVHFSFHEFILEFAQVDHRREQGIVVARVAIPPLLMTEFAELLQAMWAAYARRSMPREVDDDDGA
jgi:hypothetical protein